MARLFRKIALKARSVIASPAFFWCIFGYFVVSAIWLALTALYPMAFDEEVHYGITQLYTQHLSPILSHQPAGSYNFGPLATDPSFMFHYLMSFPLRLVRVFTTDQTTQVIVLRFIDIALMAAALPLFRRLLTRMGASRFLTNSCLALFVLVPDVPFLAAQVNYDNLLIPMVAVVLLLTVRLVDHWRKGSWDSKILLLWLASALFTSMVKYAFLPIFAAVFVYLVVVLVGSLRSGTLHWHSFSRDFGQLAIFTRTWVVVLTLILAGLFVHSYANNLIRYHKITPDCEQVLTEQQCGEYGPWARNHELENNISSDFSPNVIKFTGYWFHGMWMRSLFTIGSKSNNYQNYQPLPVMGWLITILAIGGVAGLLFWRRIFRGQPELKLLLVVILLYVFVLFADNYLAYAEVGNAVAINGRYLFPILPLVFLLWGRAFGVFLRRLKLQVALPLVSAAVILILFLQGGGAIAWIVQSHADWDWPNQTVRHANNDARQVLAPLVIGDRENR